MSPKHRSRKPARHSKRFLRPRVPDWAKDAVWYQIFPERFRNGSPANDPRADDVGAAFVKGWTVMPWGHDWYARRGWERNVGPWHKSVYMRRFGGDLLGLREKLSYLQDLGVNALYLTPIFWAPSLHKYDAICLHHVDPTFGPDRDGDLKMLTYAKETEDPSTWIWTAADQYLLDLIKEIHARHMRIILDGVFNHAGVRFFAFQHLLRFGRNSPYANWFRIKRWHSDGRFDYRGWFGHPELPEFARTRSDLAVPVRRYIFAVTKRWMDPDGDGDPSDGVDGWRLDAAFCVPHGFWKQWRRWVKRINPCAFITGEIVGRADDYLKGDEFDAVMNYAWMVPVIRCFCPSDAPMSVANFRKEMDVLRKAYPKSVQRVVQNLFDSHDVGRILTVLENRLNIGTDWENVFRVTQTQSNSSLITSCPGKSARRVLRQMVVFQMTYLGSPMIYYGTEVGMWGANDPDNRQPMLWSDLVYDNERWSPRGRLPVAHNRAPDIKLLKFYKKAIHMRHRLAALRRGELRWVKTDSERILAFERKGSPSVLAVFNVSDEPAMFRWQGTYTNAWTGKPVKRCAAHLPARGWLVLVESGHRASIGRRRKK